MIAQIENSAFRVLHALSIAPVPPPKDLMALLPNQRTDKDDTRTAQPNRNLMKTKRLLLMQKTYEENFKMFNKQKRKGLREDNEKSKAEIIVNLGSGKLNLQKRGGGDSSH